MELYNDLKISGKGLYNIINDDNIYTNEGIKFNLINSNPELSINTSNNYLNFSINNSSINFNYKNSININNKFYISSNSNIGIGFNNPQYPLDIAGSISCYDINIDNSILNKDIIKNIGFSADNFTTGILKINNGGTNSNFYNNEQILFGDIKQSSFLIWKNDNYRLGIGLDNPSENVDILGDMNADYYRINHDDIKNIFINSNDLLISSNNCFTNISNDVFIKSFNYTKNSSNNILNILNSMTIDWIKFRNNINYTKLKVGIKTKEPSYNLSIVGDINYTGELRKNGAMINIFNGDYKELYNSPGYLWDLSNGHIFNLNNGCVGIGSKNPKYILDVNGNINYSRNIRKKGNIINFFNGNYNNLLNIPNFSKFAYTGSINNLTEKPFFFDGKYSNLNNIPSFYSADWSSSISNLPNFYNTEWNTFLFNKPEYFKSDWNTSIINKPIFFDVDWNVNIFGKPDYFPSHWNMIINKPYTIYVNWNSNIINKPEFAKVAFTGQYSNLLNKPTLFDGYYSNLKEKPRYASVAFSGNYKHLSNLPNLFSGNYNDLSNLPINFQTDWNTTILNKPDFKTIAYSGLYNDLIDLPIDNWGENGNHIYNCNIGNIGIGSTNPAYKLDIDGDLNINNSLTINKLDIFQDNKPWGIYYAEDWDKTTLYDASGKNRNATTSDNIIKITEKGNGALGDITYIKGDVTTSINWPDGSIPEKFTILSLTRYTGETRRRILSNDRNGGNFLHGHWNGYRGVCHYDYWKTNVISVGNIDDWLCCIGKNSSLSPNNILIDGNPSGNNTTGNGGYKLAINDNPWNETSDWGLICVIIWDYHLPDDYCFNLNKIIQSYLNKGGILKKYFNNLYINVYSNFFINNNYNINFLSSNEHYKNSYWISDNDKNIYNLNKGSIGINNKNPSSLYILDVNGNINSSNYFLKNNFNWSSYYNNNIFYDSITNDLYITSKIDSRVLFTNGNNDILFLRFRNIGIGTNSPSSLIHIHNPLSNQEVKINLSSTFSISKSINNEGIIWNSNKEIVLGTNKIERLRILNTGNIGIGIINPSSIIHLNNPLSNQEVKINLSSTFSISKSINNEGIIWNNNNLYFGINKIERLRILNTGNIGIGTNNPYSFIHIHNPLSNQEVKINLSSTFSISKSINNEGIIWNNNNKNLYFGTNNIERLRILNTGNIGIGTNNPSSFIHIHNPLSNQEVTLFLSVAFSIYKNKYHDGILSTNDYKNLYFGTNNIERLRILTTGTNIGIGIINPSSMIHLNNPLSNQEIKINLSSTFSISKSINNEGIIWNSNKEIVIGTNNIERLRILNTGNIGIGTNNPYSFIHIHNPLSNQEVKINLSSTFSISKSINNEGIIWNNNNLYFGTNNIKRLSITEKLKAEAWGIYFAGNFSNNILYDISGNNRHALTSGIINSNFSEGNGATAKIKYISGDINSIINWPEGSIPEKFTILSLTRFTGQKKGAILQSSYKEWIHGHYVFKGLCAYGNIFQTSNNNYLNNNENWLCCIGKNGGTIPGNILIDGIKRGITGGGIGGELYRLTINNGVVSGSDWALSYLVIWNRYLTDEEMISMNSLITNYLTNGIEPSFLLNSGIINLGIGTNNPLSLIHLHNELLNQEVKINLSSTFLISKSINNDGFIWNSDKGLSFGTNNSEKLSINPKEISPWGIYFAGNFSNNILYDISGNNRHAYTTDPYFFNKGINSNFSEGNGATAKIKYISGGKYWEGLIWPEGSIPENFTILSLTRFSGEKKGTILQSTNGDWFHGHLYNKGICIYGYYMTRNYKYLDDNDNWLCCIGKNGGTIPGNILIDGIKSGIYTYTRGIGSLYSNRLCIGSSSEWALSYVVIWNRHLTDEEMIYNNSLIQNYLDTGVEPNFDNKINNNKINININDNSTILNIHNNNDEIKIKLTDNTTNINDISIYKKSNKDGYFCNDIGLVNITGNGNYISNVNNQQETFNQNYKYAYFSNDGTIVFDYDINCDILIVAGGGGGGFNGGMEGAGGGGGGGVGIGTINFKRNIKYNIKIGLGGSGSDNNQNSGINGGNTSIISEDNIINETAFGGGGAARLGLNGNNGGSGGGSSGYGGNFIGGSATKGLSLSSSVNARIYYFGQDGGNGFQRSGGSGGGGANQKGESPSREWNYNGSKGGDGILSSITGINNYYGGGGGGGIISAAYGNGNVGIGGIGGGGDGGSSTNGNGNNGVDGTGGGGGGGRAYYKGGNGGKGVVIIRFFEINNYFFFGTQNIERLRIIINNGNIGIGNINPIYNLDVNGTINATSFRGDGSLIYNLNMNNISSLIQVSKGGTGLSNLVNGQILIGNGTNNIYQTNNLIWNNLNNKLGIINTNPNYELDINGILNAKQIYRNGIYLDGSLSKWNYVSGTNNIYYNNGNIGIGLTNPSNIYKLHIQGDVKVQGNITTDYININNDIYLNNLISSKDITTTANFIGYLNGNAKTATNISASGITNQDGIWKSVNRPGPYKMYINNSDTDYSIQLSLSNQSNFYLKTYSGNNEFGNLNVASANYVKNIDPSANIYINSLNINGNQDYLINEYTNEYTYAAEANFFYYLGRFKNLLPYGKRLSFKVAGDSAFYGEIYITSDNRIKTNIKNLSNSLDKLLLLKPVSYDYIDKISNNKNNNGFIAQQIKDVIPEAISFSKEFIPNIYKIFDINDDIIETNEDLTLLLNVDDIIQIINKENKKEEFKIIEISSKHIKIDKKYEYEKCFIYGKKVEDFHILNYNYIYNLHISATQELYLKIQEQEKILKEQEIKFEEQEKQLKYLFINYY